MSAKANSRNSDSFEPNSMQQELYEEHIGEWEEWLLSEGKEGNGPEGARKPLANSTVDNLVSRLRAIFTRVWGRQGFVPRLDHEHAEDYLKALDNDDIRTGNGKVYAECSKQKQQLAIQKYFEWRTVAFGADEWDSPISFTDDSTRRNRDYFSLEEREKLRGAALTLRDIPGYGDLSPDERDRWKSYLAARLDKPKSDISPSDWEQYKTNWKIPSLVMVALDGGFRPCEIGRAKVNWLDEGKQALLIPSEESSKNKNYWQVGLRRETYRALKNWLSQRKNFAKYDGRDEIWLTRHQNPYGSRALNYTLRQLMDEANIDYSNRPELTWYAIRRSTATYVAYKSNMAQAADQLRHNNIQTTRRYLNTPVEDRRDTLEDL